MKGTVTGDTGAGLFSGRMRYSQSQLREPGFESLLIRFQSLGISVFSTMPEFTQ